MTTCNTEGTPKDNNRRGWVCLVRCWVVSTTGWTRGLLLVGGDIQFCYCTNWTHQAFRVTCSERMYCPNAVRIGSSNWSCAMKSCACECIVLLKGIRSLLVEYSYGSEKQNAYILVVDYTCTTSSSEIYLPTKLHGVTPRNNVIFIFTALSPIQYTTK